MMATPSSLQDCYFYFYSSCTKGDECPFRHCELALGSETVCSLWREGRCFRSNCKFRHMESRINRSTIPCYWENQPGGCRKPHCVFFHRKLRNGVQVIKDTPGLILPTSDGKISPKHPDLNEISSVPINVSLVEKAVESDVASDPDLTPVPPLVLSFDEGEESDTESVSSTPVKKAPLTKNPSTKASGLMEEKDFGIKTLEQIRMERIHKESDGYYGAAYTSATLEAPRLIDQHYPPKSEFLALPKDSSLDKSIPSPLVEPKLSGVDEETDLRGRLLIRRNIPSSKINQVKRLINFKKQNANQMEVDSNKMNFKIKTLAEIRKEKENKQGKSEVAINGLLLVLPALEEKKHMNVMKEKTVKKLKINRKPREKPAILKQDVSAPNRTEATQNRLVSNGIEKILPRSSDELSGKPLLNKNSSNSPGKRKSDDDSCTTASKSIKLDSSSSDRGQVYARSDGTGENHLQAILRSEIQTSCAGPEAGRSANVAGSPTSPSFRLNEIAESQSSATSIEMNSAIVSSPPSSQRSGHAFPESDRSCSDKISDKTLDSSVPPASTKNDPTSDNGARKDTLMDRSISVDEDFDELLAGDDISMDEMDAAHSDDILLEIEEFLDS